VRSGTAMKTPKNASAADHSSSCPVFSTTGPLGGFSSGDSLPCKGHECASALHLVRRKESNAALGAAVRCRRRQTATSALPPRPRCAESCT